MKKFIYWFLFIPLIGFLVIIYYSLYKSNDENIKDLRMDQNIYVFLIYFVVTLIQSASITFLLLNIF